MVESRESREGVFQQVADLEIHSTYISLQLEKAAKKRSRGSRLSLSTTPNSSEPWLERTLSILSSIDTTSPPTPARRSPNLPPPPLSMTLRDRTKGNSASPVSSPSTPRSQISPPRHVGAQGSDPGKKDTDESSDRLEPISIKGITDTPNVAEPEAPKKIPRVILRLGRDPNVK
jgi:histone deacetylase HOS3